MIHTHTPTHPHTHTIVIESIHFENFQTQILNMIHHCSTSHFDTQKNKPRHIFIDDMSWF